MKRWLGPGKVVFQDGKVIFIRHGGAFIRVSPNRLIRVGEEFTSRAKDVTGRVSTRGQEFEVAPEESRNILSEEIADQVIMNGSTPSDGNEIIQGAGPSDGDMETRSEVSQEPQGTTELERLSAEEKKICLSRNEKIQYRVDDDWVKASVISRAGKVTGKHKSWFNVKIEGSDLERSVNLEAVKWKRIADEEEVNIVMIPVRCFQAKQVELEELKNFQTYEEVDDLGQNWVSTTWVLWQKGDEVRVRLVTRGYEEEGDVRKDSPNIGKSTVRLFLTLQPQKGG